MKKSILFFLIIVLVFSGCQVKRVSETEPGSESTKTDSFEETVSPEDGENRKKSEEPDGKTDSSKECGQSGKEEAGSSSGERTEASDDKTEAEATENEPHEESFLRLTRNDWNPDVKTALNDFLSLYGSGSENYSENSYVVFDFDNTCSVFDVQTMLLVYQLENMAFKFEPAEAEEILLKGLENTGAELSLYGLEKGTEKDLVTDICTAYEKLWQSYGPFNGKEIEKEKSRALHEDPYYKEFFVKMLKMYNLVYSIESPEPASCWIMHCFTHMTGNEVYELAEACYKQYTEKETERIQYESPKETESLTGSTMVSVTYGCSVTENIKELFSALRNNGIDVYICSASMTDAVCAAVKVSGLYEYTNGIIAITMKKDEEGRYLPEYDYSAGMLINEKYAKLSGKEAFTISPTAENGYVSGGVPVNAMPVKEGKVSAIDNALRSLYNGTGPLAGFMDSSGDFFFCTEYESLKLVVCFNRAERTVRDGGGLISAVAMYQKETLNSDLKTANSEGDTLYLLQGRDENGMRSLRASEKTVIFGTEEERLFRNEENYALLEYIKQHNMSIKDALEYFATVKTPEETGLSFTTGVTDFYAGYHCIR